MRSSLTLAAQILQTRNVSVCLTLHAPLHVLTPRSDHHWQYSFLVQCTIPVLDIVASPQSPNYAEVLTLDYKIRDYLIPTALQMIDNDGIGPNHPLAMQQAMTSCTREIGA